MCDRCDFAISNPDLPKYQRKLVQQQEKTRAKIEKKISKFDQEISEQKQALRDNGKKLETFEERERELTEKYTAEYQALASKRQLEEGKLESLTQDLNDV